MEGIPLEHMVIGNEEGDLAVHVDYLLGHILPGEEFIIFQEIQELQGVERMLVDGDIGVLSVLVELVTIYQMLVPLEVEDL